MAKTKNKKRNFAEKVNSKKSKNVKKTNPFEIHVNKEKIKVLGRKAPNDLGMPGVSRAKALKKRKNTLLEEYKVQNKSNKFVDRRIGERNPQMTEEDRLMARFTAERIKAHKKKSIFNLGEDEVLTHRGQTLSEIEKFEDPRSDDDESDDNDEGRLDSNFVEDAHFGGGVLKRTDKEGAKTHKELIDQLIAESKKRKAEKQKQKEATLELTEKLDMEWKDLMPIVNRNKKTPETEEQKQKVDDYDKVMRELKFEARGTPSDRLKTEDEIAKEEKEKLEKLEQERLNRMRGFIDGSKTEPTHRSADDLDDNFIYESDDENNTLSYNEQGESTVEIHAEINGKSVKNNKKDDSEGENEDNESEDDDNNADEQSENEDDEDENDDNDTEEDNLSDLKEESTDSEMECEEIKPAIKKEVDFKQDLLERKEIMEKARAELPYTFSLPDSYDSLQKILKNQSGCHQGIIIERMIKCNHPSLGEKNKENLSMLFVYLMQHLNDLTTSIDDENSIKNCFEVFYNLVPHIFDLAQLNPENAQQSMIEIIKEKHSDYKENSKFYPGLDVLIFLKLISCLFSTSDFRHPVVTPCFVFIEQMLNKCKIRCKRDISYGLFLCTLILEYTTLSKRFLPAAINFLSGILHSAVPKSGVRIIKVIPPFKSTSSLLVLVDKHKEEVCKLSSSDLLEGEIEDSFRIMAVSTSVSLLTEYFDNYKDYSANIEIFEPVYRILQILPVENYPDRVQNGINNLISLIESGIKNRKLYFIVMESQRPKALRLYEPKIETVYDTKRYKVQSKQKAERDKLLHKLKKEHKGALREIRRDKAFLSRLKINQRIKSDMERKEKVKKLYAEAAMQQSELKALDRQKKK